MGMLPHTLINLGAKHIVRLALLEGGPLLYQWASKSIVTKTDKLLAALSALRAGSALAAGIGAAITCALLNNMAEEGTRHVQLYADTNSILLEYKTNLEQADEAAKRKAVGELLLSTELFRTTYGSLGKLVSQFDALLSS